MCQSAVVLILIGGYIHADCYIGIAVKRGDPFVSCTCAPFHCLTFCGACQCKLCVGPYRSGSYRAAERASLVCSPARLVACNSMRSSGGSILSKHIPSVPAGRCMTATSGPELTCRLHHIKRRQKPQQGAQQHNNRAVCWLNINWKKSSQQNVISVMWPGVNRMSSDREEVVSMQH